MRRGQGRSVTAPPVAPTSPPERSEVFCDVRSARGRFAASETSRSTPAGQVSETKIFTRRTSRASAGTSLVSGLAWVPLRIRSGSTRTR